MLVKKADRVTEPTRHGGEIMKEVILRGGILPNVTQIAVATFEDCLDMETHVHPTMFEVYLVLEGEAVYTVGEEEYYVNPGDFLYVPPNTPHKQQVTKAPHRIFYWGIATD